METGDCAAGNGNENKRQNRTVDNRAAALVKRGKHMHHDVRLNENNTQSQHQNCTDFKVGGQIIPRNQKQPDRQNRSNKAVQRNGD